MSGRYLLDTNIVIALINGEPAALSRLPGITALIPLPVVGELDYGARNFSRAVENLDRVERFVTGTSILLPDLDTARWYGRVRHALKVKGRPLPENDVWIAGLARQHDLTLVSRDAHFREVDALKLEAW
jgi:tRNA(fMet)-specific endonuclease VapC